MIDFSLCSFSKPVDKKVDILVDDKPSVLLVGFEKASM